MSAGTEIVGADVAGNVSIPNGDLNCSSDGVVGDSVFGNLPVDRATAETFFHVVTKEDCSTMTGSPKVGVYVKWIGKPAVTI